VNPIRSMLFRLRPEDPRRLQAFMQSVRGLGWSDSQVLSSLSTLFTAVDNLAEAEVSYYYRRRGTRAWISGVTRIGAWICGSIGLVLPLLASTDAPNLKNVGQYGYAFLAVAASFLAANSLFGGTDGHIRFVSTQLNLEKLITASRIQWCRYLSELPTTKEELAKGFDMILNYAGELHTTTISETGKWGESLIAALKDYRETMKNASTGSTVPH
jgi:SMODS and SLOG-associating 2TM effector domain 2